MAHPPVAPLADVISAARLILEESGPDAVTMSAVASRVGVKPPSLYKKVSDRYAILGLVASQVAAELADRFDDILSTTPDPRIALAKLCTAYRHMASEAPRATSLLFITPNDDAQPPTDATQRTLDQLHATVGRIVDGDPQPAARTLTSWVFGFCTMEQGGAFRSGGNVDEAFAWGLQRLIAYL